MSELTDDQLDGLFRKSAEEFDPPVDPGAWPAMKTLLDDHDRTAPLPPSLWKKLSRWGLPLLALLLLTGGGWYAYRNGKTSTVQPTASICPLPTEASTNTNSKDEQFTRNQSIIESESRGKRIVTGENSPVGSPPDAVADGAVLTRTVDGSVRKFTGTSPDANKAEPTARATKRASGTYRSTKRTVDNRNKATASLFSVSKNERTVRLLRTGGKQSRPATGHMLSRRQSFDSNLSLTFSKGTHATTVNPSLSSQRSAEITYSLPPTGPIKQREQTSELVTFPELNMLKSRSVKLSDSLSQIRQSVEAQPVVSALPSVALPYEKGFSIRVAISPDLSTIGLRNFSRPGTNVGLLAEYRLAKRWSIQTGVIQSMKVYRALASEYSVPAGMWSGSYKTPLYIDSRCNMLDIPVNIRYDIAARPRTNGRPDSRWFVSGGVTNYVMEKEDYTYTFPPHTYGQPEDWSNPNPGGYRLSNLNVSVGYERALGQRFFWQVEPFLKAPLRGIGAFKIDLLSTGVFFSLRYKL